MHLVIDLQGAQGDNRARGIGRYSRELARAMAAAPRDHDITIALNANLETAPLQAAFAGLAETRLWHAPSGTAASRANASAPDTARRRRAAEALRAEALAALRPDLLHVSSLFEGWPDDAVTTWPATRARPPIAATGYDLIPLIRRAEYLDGVWKNSDLPTWYLRCLHELRLADTLLAISDSSRQELITHLGHPPESVVAIGTGIGPEFRPPHHTPAERDALLRRLGLRPDSILFLGGGDLRKNEPGLIRAYARLPAALRARHKLAIIRRGDHDALRALATAEGIAADSLNLVEHVPEPDLPGLYAACALFVFPSFHEGFGLPAAEAMACGAPTIASNATSLPEVIGRADALFDPASPDAIAARMREVLESPALRASLAAHAPQQAARFTWPGVAARAWAALEHAHARRGHTPLVPVRRPSLAVVAPLPPQPSGISDYTAELLPELARHYAITVVAEVPATTAEHVAANLPLISPETFQATAPAFDRMLYQIGNSEFHATALDTLLPAIPGAVTLHDAFLSGLRNWSAQAANTPQAFLAELHRAHGWPALARATRDGTTAALRAYPCSLDVLRLASGLILHSRHAQALLAEHYGPESLAGAAIIPHLRAPHPPADRAAARRALGIPADTYLVCSFGHAATTKLPARLAAAWRRAGLHAPAARLVLVGGADPDIGDIAPATSTGRTSAETYRAWLAAADVAVQLRATSRGETSGAILDALAAGLPVIANAHGSAAELPPDAMVLLPEPAPEPLLAEALLRLRDPAERSRYAQAAHAHLARHHAPRAIAALYRDAIEAAHATPRHRATRALAATLAGADPALLADAARALARAHPEPRPPTTFIDVTTFPLTQGMPATAHLAQLLTTHPIGQRVDLIRHHAGAWRHPHPATATLLGLPSPGPEEPADLAHATIHAIGPPHAARDALETSPLPLPLPQAAE